MLHSSIGQGGGGVVYEGIVEATGLPVAVKLLHPRAAGNVSEALRELDRLAEVRSPVVPHVFEYGWHQNQIFIVTELVEGTDPIEFARSLNLRERVELLARIADAVRTLNARGILHRDIKPSNIVITPDGNPVLLDLGIASLLGDGAGPHAWAEGIVQGTRRYMCPEQGQGRNTECTTAWDVYALGVLGCELLAGHDHRDQEAMTGVSEELGAEALRGCTPDASLPPKLRAILCKACSVDPGDRYENALQFRDDLHAWLRREPTIAGQHRLWARLTRRFAARPILTVAAICALIFVSSVTATGLIVWRQNTQPYRFERVENSAGQSMLALFSVSGRILHEWAVDGRDRIGRNCRLLEWNGEQLAVIGFGAPERQTGHEGLVVYRRGRWEDPLWVAEQTVPVGMSHVTRFDRPPHKFRYMKHFFADVFPDEPGEEVVSFHRHVPSSLCAIQVHSLDGRLLSEYYHDGWIESGVWVPSARQLVMVGQNSDGLWESRGIVEPVAGQYPLVIFAIRPRLGQVAEPINHPGLGLGTEPRWYQCLLPPKVYAPFYSRYGENHGLGPAVKSDKVERGMVKWQLGEVIRFGETEGHITLEIDAHGELVKAWHTDTWKGGDFGLSASDYTLGELPPRVVARKHEPIRSEETGVP
ncbi:MAG: serine/threonine-protein kinase [Phycisphaerales bacterium]